jgi:hypothetical protein
MVKPDGPLAAFCGRFCVADSATGALGFVSLLVKRDDQAIDAVDAQDFGKFDLASPAR